MYKVLFSVTVLLSESIFIAMRSTIMGLIIVASKQQQSSRDYANTLMDPKTNDQQKSVFVSALNRS